MNTSPGPSSPRDRPGAAHGQAVLADVPGDHRDRGGRLVVVVEAGVLVLGPADHPRVDVARRPRSARTRARRRSGGRDRATAPARRRGGGRTARALRRSPSYGSRLVDEAGARSPRAAPHGRSGSGSIIGRSEPYTSCSAPTQPGDHLDRNRAVARGVVERERIAQLDRRSAARLQPLRQQRRVAGEHREHDRQVGVLAPAERRERQPCRLHLRDVVGQRAPPQRFAQRRLGVRVDGAPPGWTKQRHAALAARSSSGPASSSASGPASAVAGSETPTQPRASTVSTSSGSGCSSATGPHAANCSGSAATPSRWAVDQLRASARAAASRSRSGSRSRSARGRRRPRASWLARASGRLARRSRTAARPAEWSTVRPSRGGRTGATSRTASASSSGGVQMCWWTSTRKSNSTKFLQIMLKARKGGCGRLRGGRHAAGEATRGGTINVAIVDTPNTEDLARLTPSLFTAKSHIRVNYTILDEDTLRERRRERRGRSRPSVRRGDDRSVRGAAVRQGWLHHRPDADGLVGQRLQAGRHHPVDPQRAVIRRRGSTRRRSTGSRRS